MSLDAPDFTPESEAKQLKEQESNSNLKRQKVDPVQTPELQIPDQPNSEVAILPSADALEKEEDILHYLNKEDE